MATPSVSTQTTYNLEIDEIVRDALERIGGEWTNAEEQKSARRSLNLLFIDLQNRGFPLAKLELTEQALTSGTASYALDGSIADLLDVAVNDGSTDIQISKISFTDYLAISNKEQESMPTEVLVDRGLDNITITVWPVPPSDDYTLKFWAIKRINAVTKGFQYPDISYRYLPAIISGLAYFMGWKRPGLSIEDKALLKGQYLEDLELAFDEDRERVNVQLVPSVASPL